ncbi:helix-turn-helix domain-containing protein [Myroides odoratus]|uniref:L-rhamnose operon regulatory protein rhaS n=1 Tax=Myroides odoratus TaxID=256 RepID=A0A378RJT8_MYROD|nr:helix-turn-helix domain-containing protein [Myroides odoratus]MCS4238527.1 AraC-like DNA-binding protein [Myroides odoratus]MDH6600541.1 AraC family transcriptional activator of pobA [Myroides gitamensis]QQU05185.1 helix-turn-helix domain-containing protein [Myroides odoratus]STZ27323.1 L-rhamnose operon regulatory protein rhaS [Myroides odoratus]
MYNGNLNKQVLSDSRGERREFIAMKLQHALRLENSYTIPMQKNDFFQIILITAGTGIQYIDLQAYEVKAGDIVFINTWQQYRWSFNASTQGYLLSFTPSFITQFVSDHLFVHDLPFFKRFTSHHLVELGDELKDILLIAMERILKEYETEDGEYINLIRTYLLEILLLCKKEIDQTSLTSLTSIKSNDLIKSFESLIDKHFYEYRFPKEYAKVLLVTPNYLNAMCQKVKQKSAGDMIRDRILIECKRLLLHTNLSASEIAYQLNFKDNSYFSRFFKKHIGIAPDEFRRR